MLDKLDIIIPTWNAMPEFETTLNCLESAFGKRLNNIIVMDRKSDDGTVELAEKYQCDIVTDTKSLGSARLRGLQIARTEWICFVDSDIELPVDWFAWMKRKYRNTPSNRNVGWLFGKPLDSREKIRKMQLWEAKNKDGLYGGFLHGNNFVPVGKKGMTNNSLCLREPLLKAEETNIREVSGWEDWILSQVLFEQGYSIVEVPLFCEHLRVHTFDKWGVYTKQFSISGQMKAGTKPTIRKYFWMIPKGVKFSFLFRDFWYLKYHINLFRTVLKALKNPVEWDRGKTKWSIEKKESVDSLANQ